MTEAEQKLFADLAESQRAMAVSMRAQTISNEHLAEVLEVLMSGMSQKKQAAILGVSTKTVERRRAKRRAQLAMIGVNL